MLYLNYAIGRFISINSRTAKWGSNAIKIISELLQKELPGLRGYSESNIKLMRTFYEGWKDVFENRQLTTGDFNRITIKELEIRQMASDEFTENDLECFLNVGFSNHFKTIKHIETDGCCDLSYIKRTSGKTSGSLAGYGGSEEVDVTTSCFS